MDDILVKLCSYVKSSARVDPARSIQSKSNSEATSEAIRFIFQKVRQVFDVLSNNALMCEIMSSPHLRRK
jgi:hypothetical protein